MSIEQLITDYGYPLLSIGTFLEGESVLVTAGFLAYRGFLELPVVIVAAFLGAFACDQMFFHLGRIKGASFLDKRPHWKARTDKVRKLLRRHQVPVILGVRFMYGLRNITPFMLGMSRLSSMRFFVLNGIAVFIWAVVIGTAGFAFGQAIELVLEEIKKYELWIILGILIVGAGFWARRLIRPTLRGRLSGKKEAERL